MSISSLVLKQVTWMSPAVFLVAKKAAARGSAIPGIFDQLDLEMVSAPSNIMGAYQQAVYFLAIGAMRATKNEEKGAADFLREALVQFQSAGDKTYAEVNWFCSSTGYACPAGGSGRVLQQALDAIESSGLSAEPAGQINAIIRSNIWGFNVKRALPIAGVLGLGVLAGTLWYRHKRRA